MAGTCAKIVLVIVNLVITLIGVGFFVSGIILRFAADTVEGYVNLKELADRIPEFAEKAGLLDVNDDKIKDSVAAYTGFEVIGVVLIVIGLFVAITGALGMCGACCTNKCMLVSYIIIVIIGVLAQIAIVAAFSTNTYVDQTKDYFKDTLKKKYKGIDDYEFESLIWNYVMIGYGCCGLEHGDEFEDAKKWKREREVDLYGNGTGVEIELEYPVACCKTKGSFPGNIKPKNSTCTIEHTKENSNYKKGCWTSLEDDIKEDMITSAVTVAVFLFVQILCAILAICILVKNRKDKSDQYA